MGGDGHAPDRKIPYAGFRFVSAIMNAGIWFGIGSALAFGVGGRLDELGRFGPRGAAILAGGVAFLVAFFGRAGAQTSFLKMASSGRVALPDAARWGSPGAFEALWMRGFLIGIAAALVTAVVASFALAGMDGASRSTLCLVVAAIAATLAAAQSSWLSRPTFLGDLRGGVAKAAPDRAYLARRVAFPQAIGNGAITAFIAVGTFSPEAMQTRALAIDSAMTALVIGAFVLLGSNGIIVTDRKLERVAPLRGPGPSKIARAGSLVVAVVVAGALGALVAIALGPDASTVMYAVWKGGLGAAVAFGLAMPAGRVALAETSTSTSSDRAP